MSRHFPIFIRILHIRETDIMRFSPEPPQLPPANLYCEWRKLDTPLDIEMLRNYDLDNAMGELQTSQQLRMDREQDEVGTAIVAPLGILPSVDAWAAYVQKDCNKSPSMGGISSPRWRLFLLRGDFASGMSVSGDFRRLFFSASPIVLGTAPNTSMKSTNLVYSKGAGYTRT